MVTTFQVGDSIRLDWQLLLKKVRNGAEINDEVIDPTGYE